MAAMPPGGLSCTGTTPVNDMDSNEDHHKPDLPDLPDTDDDVLAAPPAPSLARRLMMSRELRGWMAVAAALVVATAAIAPAIDYDRLAGFVAPTVETPVEGEGCNDEDQSSGFNGQHVSCSFTCSDEAGTVSISVEADDKDAGVSGTASCGGTDAHCTGTQTCSETQTRDGGGEGDCSADSDEAYDSGLYVACSSKVTKTPIPDGPVDPEEPVCPLSKPVPVCTNPVCYQFKSTLASKCQLVWERIANTISPATHTTAFVVDADGAAGLVCAGFVCQPYQPACEVANGLRTCA